MPSDGNILEMTMRSVYPLNTNECLNVFQYRLNTTAPFTLADKGDELLEAWVAAQMTVLAPILSADFAVVGGKIVNLTNPAEIFDGNLNDAIAGSIGGDGMPPFVSWGFLLRRESAVTRNGYKRFAGVPESLQSGGIPIVQTALILPGIADALGASVILADFDGEGTDVELIPVIVRKSPSGALVTTNDVIGGQFRSIGSQNTRKF